MCSHQGLEQAAYDGMSLERHIGHLRLAFRVWLGVVKLGEQVATPEFRPYPYSPISLSRALPSEASSRCLHIPRVKKLTVFATPKDKEFTPFRVSLSSVFPASAHPPPPAF